MKTTLTPADLKKITGKLKSANADYSRQNPGETPKRQPVHTVYGGAHLFKAGTAARIGELARASLAANAPDAKTFAEALGIDAALAPVVYQRVSEKLQLRRVRAEEPCVRF